MRYEYVGVVGCLLLIAGFFYCRKQAERRVIRRKGEEGESSVAYYLEKLSGRKYRVLNNVMLQTSFGTSQIDHIVISRYGIFVIETKNYRGLITGNEMSTTWTQYMSGKKRYFNNPIHQNYGHIKALEELLADDFDSLSACPSELSHCGGLLCALLRALFRSGRRSPFVSIITFPEECRLQINTKTAVVCWGKIVRTIRKYRRQMIPREQVDEIAEMISEHNIDSRQARRLHVKEVKNKVTADRKSVRRKICPRCGAKLVKKKGRYGRFYSCSEYPKCRYTTGIGKKF